MGLDLDGRGVADNYATPTSPSADMIMTYNGLQSDHYVEQKVGAQARVKCVKGLYGKEQDV